MNWSRHQNQFKSYWLTLAVYVLAICLTFFAILPINSYGSADTRSGACRIILEVLTSPVYVNWQDLQSREVNPVIENIIRKSPKYTFSTALYNYNFMAKMTEAELASIAYNNDAYKIFALSYRNPLSAFYEDQPEYIREAIRKKTQVAARILISNLLITDLVPKGEAYTDAQFAEHAALAGLELSKIGEAFRFDQRSPEQIIEAKGFFPSKEKKVLSLLEHSVASSLGGRYVSATLKSDNERILPQPTFQNRVSIYDSEHLKKILNLRGYNVNEIETVEEFKDAFEYRTVDVAGVVAESHGIEAEKEIVVNYIPSAKITHYRRASYIVFESKKHFLESESIFGPWLEMP